MHCDSAEKLNSKIAVARMYANHILRYKASFKRERGCYMMDLNFNARMYEDIRIFFINH